MSCFNDAHAGAESHSPPSRPTTARSAQPQLNFDRSPASPARPPVPRLPTHGQILSTPQDCEIWAPQLHDIEHEHQGTRHLASAETDKEEREEEVEEADEEATARQRQHAVPASPPEGTRGQAVAAPSPRRRQVVAYVRGGLCAVVVVAFRERGMCAGGTPCRSRVNDNHHGVLEGASSGAAAAAADSNPDAEPSAAPHQGLECEVVSDGNNGGNGGTGEGRGGGEATRESETSTAPASRSKSKVAGRGWSQRRVRESVWW